MQPARFAVGVMLVLPDRHAPLHFVDDPTARRERGVAMVGADADPDGHLADRERAGAMHAARSAKAELRARLLENYLAFVFGERAVRLVIEARHRTRFVV